MLSFAEEVYLLALDDTTGKLAVADDDVVLGGAIVGAVLGELSFMDRIDSDQNNLIVLDTAATGNQVVDCVLEELAASGDRRLPIREAIGRLQELGTTLETLTRDELIKKGIIKEEQGRVLWVIPSRHYPVIDNTELVDVERRLRNIVTDPEEIPEPRDTVLISLVSMCGLFEEILSPRELRRHRDRIEQLARLDLVGQKVLQNIASFYEAMASGGYY